MEAPPRFGERQPGEFSQAAGEEEGQRARFVIILLAALAALAALALPMAEGAVYLKDDLGRYYFPTRFLYARSLAAGHDFTWTPEMFCGFYLHGEGQVGMLHPLHLLLYRWLPLETAFAIELLSIFPFAMAGTFLLLRHWGLERDAALLGGCGFAFSGFNLLHLVHPNLVAVTAHLPWLLLAIEHALAKEPRRAAWGRLGVVLLTISQLLLGHPQGAWLTGVAELAYLLWRSAGCLPDVLTVGAAKALGIVGGMAQLLPTWETVGASTRAEPGFFEGHRFALPLEPANLLQLLNPYLIPDRVYGSPFAQEGVLYGGSFGTLALVWVAMRGRDSGPRRGLALASLALSALALLLAMGRYGGLGLLVSRLPLVSWFGAPGRYVVLFHFGMAVATALAFSVLANLVGRGERVPWSQLWPLLLLPLSSVAVTGAATLLFVWPEIAPDVIEGLSSPLNILAGAAVVTVVTAFCIAAARGRAGAATALAALAVLDPALYGISWLHQPYPPLPVRLYVSGQAQPPGRTAGRIQADNNALFMAGFSLANGYAAFPPAERRGPLELEQLRISGVSWIQLTTPWGSRARLSESIRVETMQVRETSDALGRAAIWARVPDPLPRAWLRAGPRGDAREVEWPLRPAASAAVSVERDEPGVVRLTTVSAVPGMLVVSESWHSGWVVYVDGELHPVVRFQGGFLGCALSPGTHAVEFRFRPSSLRTGLRLSGLALVVAALWTARSLRREKTARPG